MKNQFERLFFRWIYVLGGITLALYIYSLFHRPIHVDTAILGEPVYWLHHDGVLRSELQRGWFHAEDHFFFTHKLFLFVGAGWTKLIGWGAVALDSLGLVYFALLLLAWWNISKDSLGGRALSPRYFALFFLLLLTNHHIYELSFVFRPEIGLAACAAWAFFFLHRFLKDEGFFSFLLASLFAALGVGHHLNGVIFVVAGFVLLSFEKKYVAAVGYGLIGALGLSFYFIDIRSLSDFNLMILQLFNMQDIQSEHKTLLHYVINIPKEQSRYLHSPIEIGFTLLTFPVIILNIRLLWKSHRDLLVYTATAMASLALISHDKDTKYMALVMPALTFLACVAMKNLFHEDLLSDSRRWIPTRLIPVLICLFFIGQWRSNYSLTFDHYHETQNYEKLAKDLPEHLNILGPTAAVFWALQHEHRFQSQIVYKILNSHHSFDMDREHLQVALSENHIDVVIMDREFMKIFKLENPNIANFQVIGQDAEQGLYLLRRTSTL